MKTGSKNNIAFTFASSEVNFVSQQFIKLIELLTGKIKLKKFIFLILVLKMIGEKY